MMRWMLLSLLTCTFAATNAAHAGPPSPADDGAGTMLRLEAILERLEAIEERLTAIEEIERRRYDFWIDENGVMRLPSGEPIGFWGIDDPRRGSRAR